MVRFSLLLGALGLLACRADNDRVVGGVPFQIDLPAGARVERRGADRVEWRTGDGLTVLVRVAGRPQQIVHGKPQVVPCEPSELEGSPGSESMDGHTTRVYRGICIGSGASSLDCEVSHSRGHLDSSEAAKGTAVCASLRGP